MNPNMEKGIKAENFIANFIRGEFKPETFGIEQNHTWGVDIVLKTAKTDIKIEVKSANRFVKKNGRGMKSGSFSFYPDNIDRADYFAFVIYNFRNVPRTYWVKGFTIRKHFESRKIRNTKFTLGIPTLLAKIPKLDFSEVIS